MRRLKKGLRKRQKNGLTRCVGTAALLGLGSGAALAQGTAEAPTAPNAGDTLTEIVVTGTRLQTGVRAADSAAPIEVIGAQAFQHVGQPDLDQALQQNVPSFNVQQFGEDTAALTVQAALRGLNPNDTLVLVNGKRRTSTANLSVDAGSPYSGAATVDLSLIPVAAIDHVEVLTDGAAAQYGSDAIAGVVNIILKDSAKGGAISATGGQYYAGDGATGAWSINKGFDLGGRGFLNVTFDQRYHDFSREGGADSRFSNKNGSLLPSIDSDPTANAIDLAGLPGAPGYPKENHQIGDTQYNLYDGFYNAGYDFSDQLQVYSFGSYASRTAAAIQNYRAPSIVYANAAATNPDGSINPGGGDLVVPFPNGFSPREKFNEYDYNFTAGIKGEIEGWHLDLASSYGKDHDEVYTIDSANPGLFSALQENSLAPVTPQTDFYDGAFQSTQWTTNLDIDKAFSVGLASPLNVAYGAEVRRDTFSISAGEPASYEDGGPQSFVGYSSINAGPHSRDNYAGYIDLAAEVVTGVRVDLAGRHEHYSDFGDATVGKFTARYDITPQFAIRGTVSNGFRAPTLAEEFYSGTNVAPTYAYAQLPANSAAAKLAGFQPLQPERSTNFSAGFVAHPIPRLQITADYYHIDLRDRILNSGSIVGYSAGYGASGVVSQNVLNAVSAAGVHIPLAGLTYVGLQIFANAVDTVTQGVEFTTSYASDFDQYGHVDWTLGFNYNDTAVTRELPLPAAVYNADFNRTLVTPNSLSALLTGTPREKVIANATWTLAKWSVNLRETVYGPSSELDSFNITGAGAGATRVRLGTAGITDLDLGYRITSGLRVNIGANNLLNRHPSTVPDITNGSGGLRPADGSYVYGEPAPFSPYGFNGGYYYGRVTYSF